MKLDVYSKAGEKTGELEVSDKVFGAEVKRHLFWEVVRWQDAKRRAGTHSAKGRGEVSGRSQKAFRQKGTGRARHGDSKAPIFVGGGQAHGPSPRDYSYQLNKKVRAGALRSALSMKVGEGRLRVVEDLSMSRPRTKDALGVINALGLSKVLVVDDGNDALNKSIRNLPRHKYLAWEGLNVKDLLRYNEVVLTRSAVEKLEGRLG